MRRAVATLLALAGTARADGIPGTGDDPIHELELSPAVADTPLLDGLSLRGGSAADTMMLLDGFEVPVVWHGRRLRSTLAPGIAQGEVMIDGVDPAAGRAASFIVIPTNEVTRKASLQVGASLLDASIAARHRFSDGRGALVYRHSLADSIADDRYSDLVGRIDHPLTPRWRLEISGISATDAGKDDTDPRALAGRRALARAILTAHYRSKYLTVWLAASTLWMRRELERGAQHLRDRRNTIDTRAVLVRSWYRALGLSQVEWKVGWETNAAHRDLDIAMPREARDGSPRSPMPDPTDTSTTFDGTFWTNDLAGHTSFAANLDSKVRIDGGLRVDRFGRGDDIAVQPRGAIDVTFTRKTTARLAAAAFRRPPQQGEELLYPYLHPERTTQLSATLHRSLTPESDAYIIGYYIDRSHLIVRDRATETLVNTGRGTTYGAEAIVNGQIGRWFGAASASLASSTRIDYERGPERPSDFDQPFRLDAMAGYRGAKKNWQIATRVQLASGLPVTPIAAIVYNADRDHFDPLFGPASSERLPFQHRVDVRFDRVFRIEDRLSLAAVVDIANVYAAQTPIGYAYSYDYRERLDVTHPIVPYAGLTLRYDE